jgi:molybdate-binding protein
VAEAIRNGWADAGVCLRLVSEEAGLGFLPVREGIYELCFPKHWADDPRIQALVNVVRSPSYQRDLRELPGYKTVGTGELRQVR